MTRMAHKLGMDPVEFRRKNAIREGDTLAYGAKMNPCGLQESIDRVAAEIGWGKKEVSKDPDKVIGKGFACFWKAPAMPPNAASCGVHQVQRGRQLEHQRLGHGNRPGLPDRDGPNRRRDPHRAGQEDSRRATRTPTATRTSGRPSALT